MKTTQNLFLFLCVLTFGLSGCKGYSGGSKASTSTPPSAGLVVISAASAAAFSSTQTIISSSCLSCHSGSSSPNLSTLTTQQAYVTAGLVSPGSPGSSLLFTCLTNNGLVSPTGVAMPQGSALSGSEIQTIHDWISSMTVAAATPTPNPAASPTPAPTASATSAFAAAQAVFSTSCVSCHGAGGSFPNIASFTTEALWQSSGLVTAGSPTNSAIFTTLTNNGISTPTTPMPPSSALSNTAITTIQTWITGMTPTTTMTPAQMRFSAAQTILASSCFGCHSAGQHSPNLSGLTTEAQWLTSKRVVAGFPSKSSIYTVLKGSGYSSDDSMPPGTGLTATQLSTISNWITNIGK